MLAKEDHNLISLIYVRPFKSRTLGTRLELDQKIFCTRSGQHVTVQNHLISHHKHNRLMLLHSGHLVLVAGSGCLNLSDLIIHCLLNIENKLVYNISCNLNFLCQMVIVFNIELTRSGTQG
jgi:hypothetical protein